MKHKKIHGALATGVIAVSLLVPTAASAQAVEGSSSTPAISSGLVANPPAFANLSPDQAAAVRNAGGDVDALRIILAERLQEIDAQEKQLLGEAADRERAQVEKVISDREAVEDDALAVKIIDYRRATAVAQEAERADMKAAHERKSAKARALLERWIAYSSPYFKETQRAALEFALARDKHYQESMLNTRIANQNQSMERAIASWENNLDKEQLARATADRDAVEKNIADRAAKQKLHFAQFSADNFAMLDALAAAAKAPSA